MDDGDVAQRVLLADGTEKLLVQGTAIQRVVRAAVAIGGIQMIADIVHLRLVNKHALVDGDDGAGLQLAFRADDLDVFRGMRFKPAERIHELAVFVGLPNMLHIIRDFFQAFLLAEHQDKAVFTHARIAFPTVVHVTIIPVIADDPKGI